METSTVEQGRARRPVRWAGRAALLALPAALAAGGCASPPSPVDLTPRFVAGQRRVESLMTYAALRSAVLDVTAHVGISWQAEVVEVDARGATIEAQVSRVVCKLPGVPAFDTKGGLPLGIVDVGALVLRLLGVGFRYAVTPAGEVTVSGWDAALAGASRATGVPVPDDGSVPDEGVLQEALARVYGGPLPRRPVVLGEAWSATQDYHVGAAGAGARVTASDRFVYEGFGELEVPFGKDLVTVEGLRAPLRSAPAVRAAGRCFLGTVRPQAARGEGALVVGASGDHVLGYWEASRFEIEAAPGLGGGGAAGVAGAALGAVVSALADLERGWAFHSPTGWR